MHSSQEVLAILSNKGIRIHRETLARVSDELGLATRVRETRGAPRTWNTQQAEQLAVHFHTNGWKQMVPISRRLVTDSEGPFRTRDVLAFLEVRGLALHRGTLARISDELGLHTRDEQAPTVQRQWTRQQVDELATFLEDRRSQLERDRQERERAARREQERREQERLDRKRLECERLEYERHQRELAKTGQALAAVDAEDLRSLLEADPSLAERLRGLLVASEKAASPTPSPGHPASTDEEAA